MVPLGHVEKRETRFQLQKCQSAAVWRVDWKEKSVELTKINTVVVCRRSVKLRKLFFVCG